MTAPAGSAAAQRPLGAPGNKGGDCEQRVDFRDPDEIPGEELFVTSEYPTAQKGAPHATLALSTP